VQKSIYLDHNATSPVHSDLFARVPDWLNVWGNPSSIHWAGREPKKIIREARAALAEMLGVDPLELIFTSGGSESNNQALKAASKHPKKNQIIISAVEHPSVIKAAAFLKTQGFQVDVLPVNRSGEISLERLGELLSDKTALVTVMAANNETGHIFPIRKIAELTHAAGALVHCDAVQALGKIPVSLREMGVDLASFSGHKFYALKGCGVLYARRGLELESLIHGGGQERGRRAGTENLLAIASLGFMARLRDQIPAESKRIGDLRDQMEAEILKEITGVTVTGQSGLRLPNTSSLVITGVDGESLLMNLDVKGFAVSTGAACSAGSPEPSPTLLAMGLTRAEAQSSLRLSLGWSTQPEDIESFIRTLTAVVQRLRKISENGNHV
jgi:cysteine desulfurase